MCLNSVKKEKMFTNENPIIKTTVFEVLLIILLLTNSTVTKIW